MGKNKRVVTTQRGGTVITEDIGAKGVKFVYKDDSGKDGEKEPMRYRPIIYWQFDEKGKKLDDAPGGNDRLWDISNLIMPCGCGITDKRGVLRSVRPHEEIDFTDTSGTAPVKDENGDTRFLYYNKYRSSPDSYKLSMERFDPGKKVGFMAMPLELMGFDEFQTRDLTKMRDAKSCPGGWVGQLEEHEQEIELHCTLPEWEHRLLQRIKPLENAQLEYADVVRKDLKEISQIDAMTSLVEMMLRYKPIIPEKQQEQAEKIITALGNFHDKISADRIVNEDVNTPCGKALKKIDDAAKRLWDLMRSKELAAEITRYVEYYKDEQPVGPYTTIEKDWRGFFTTLARAYYALSKTGLVKDVFDEHVVPMLRFLGEYAGGPKVSDKFLKDITAGTNSTGRTGSAGESGPPPDDKETPIFAALKPYASLGSAAIANTPGPPSLVVAIINAFGHHWAGKVCAAKDAALAQEMMKPMLGLMKFFNGGEPVPDSIRKSLETAIKDGDLARGKTTLTEFCTSKGSHVRARAFKYMARIYRGLMFVFSLITFVAAITDDTENTFLKWMNIIASSSSLALTSLGMLCLKFAGLAETAAFKISTNVLGVFAGVASAIVSYTEATVAADEGDYAKAWLKFASGTGAVVLTIGFILVKLGASVSWAGGVGLALMLVGTLVIVVFELWDLLRELFRAGTRIQFEAMLKSFTSSGVYQQCYRYIDGVEDAHLDVKRAMNGMDWWEMSWRAVVPLHVSGYRREAIEKMTVLDDDHVNDLIVYYRDLKINHPDKYTDKEGGPDFWELEMGTFSYTQEIDKIIKGGIYDKKRYYSSHYPRYVRGDDGRSGGDADGGHGSGGGGGDSDRPGGDPDGGSY